MRLRIDRVVIFKFLLDQKKEQLELKKKIRKLTFEKEMHFANLLIYA